jgi:hypothetical protein
MKPLMWVLIFVAPLALLANRKKPTGEISDRAAFAKIASYCVDTKDLAKDAAYLVNGFVETESRPKKLLSKLPWKLLPDCRNANPDVVLQVDFPFLKSINVRGGARPLGEPEFYKIKAVLQVSEAESNRLLYKVQALPLTSGPDESVTATEAPLPVLRRDALYGVFSTLIEDVELVSKAQKK